MGVSVVSALPTGPTPKVNDQKDIKCRLHRYADGRGLTLRFRI